VRPHGRQSTDRVNACLDVHSRSKLTAICPLRHSDVLSAPPRAFNGPQRLQMRSMACQMFAVSTELNSTTCENGSFAVYRGFETNPKP
jgi:hypothetical protein